MSSPPRKRVRLTVEWVGAAGELDFGRVLAEEIERYDASGRARVVALEELTSFGTTELVGPRRLDPDR